MGFYDTTITVIVVFVTLKYFKSVAKMVKKNG